MFTSFTPVIYIQTTLSTLFQPYKHHRWYSHRIVFCLHKYCTCSDLATFSFPPCPVCTETITSGMTLQNRIQPANICHIRCILRTLICPCIPYIHKILVSYLLLHILLLHIHQRKGLFCLHDFGNHSAVFDQAVSVTHILLDDIRLAVDRVFPFEHIGKAVITPDAL